jgi:hypothetical protein
MNCLLALKASPGNWESFALPCGRACSIRNKKTAFTGVLEKHEINNPKEKTTGYLPATDSRFPCGSNLRDWLK